MAKQMQMFLTACYQCYHDIFADVRSALDGQFFLLLFIVNKKNNYFSSYILVLALQCVHF